MTQRKLHTLTQKRLNRCNDVVLLDDFGFDQFFVLDLLQRLHEEVAEAAFHLSIAEQVQRGQQRLVQQLQAALIVVAAEILAVRKMERIQVPFGGIVVSADDRSSRIFWITARSSFRPQARTTI